MSWYYPYGFRWFQDGGNVLPGMMLSPWEAGRYMARGWYQDGGGVGWPAGVPTPREMAMAAAVQRAFAPAPERVVAPSQNEVKKKEEPKKKRIIPPPAEPRMRGDTPMSFGLPTQDQVGDLIQQKVAEQQRLQGQLERMGYKGAYAAAMSRQGRGKLPENVQEKLDNQESSDYRVKHHPDYDPSRPVEDQQDLNYDNSFRTTVLRGANMFTDSGNPVMDFVAGAATGAGRSFANIVLDAPKRYVEPIVEQGWRGVPESVGNLGMDVMGLATTNAVGNRIANRLVSRGLPEASASMENQVLRFYTPGTPRAGAVRAPVSDMKGQGAPFRSVDVDPERSFAEMPVSKGFKDDVVNTAYDYYNLTKHPDYIKRVQALDKELGLNGELERRLKLFHEQGEQVAEGKLPFNIRMGKIGTTDATFGRAQLLQEIEDDVIDKYNKGLMTAQEVNKVWERYFPPQQREVLISPKLDPKTMKLVVPHEFKHHWTSNLEGKDPAIQKYAAWLRSMAPEQVDDLLYQDLFKSIDPSLKSNQVVERLDYFLKPTELDAFINTSVRQDMVEKGFLESPFDELTEDVLDDYVMEKLYVQKPASGLIRTYFTPGNELLDKQRFLKVFNKGLPVATGVAAGAGVMGAAQEQKKWGGEKRKKLGRKVPGMPLIGVRGVI